MSKKYPRIRNLPKEEQGAFEEFLAGQTRPLVSGVPMSEQDYYYPWDYEQFKKYKTADKIPSGEWD